MASFRLTPQGDTVTGALTCVICGKPDPGKEYKDTPEGRMSRSLPAGPNDCQAHSIDEIESFLRFNDRNSRSTN